MAGGISMMLTGEDMRNKLGYDIPMWSIPQLEHIKDIDEIFTNEKGQRFNNALLLYQTSNNGNSVVGHWTLLKRIDEDNIVHFDSYGTFPDKQLLKIDPEYRKKTNQIKKNLSRLLDKSKYENIHYNPHKLQKYYRYIGGNKMRINTCGRHCIIYAKNNYDPEEYYTRLNKLKNIVEKSNGYTTYDDLVVSLTE